MLGALNATAAMLPFVLSYGFIVFGALGAAAAQVGLTASVVAVVIGGAAMALFGRARLPAASPSASSTLILGGAVLTLLRDPALRPDAPDGLALLLAMTALCVTGSGLLLMLLGALRAGNLVRFVPQPVLAGFMNGVAILIVVSQLPPLLGLPADAWARDGLRSLAAWQGPALAVAVATALLVMLIGRHWPRAPAPLLALVLASGVVVAWKGMAPGGALAALRQIGPLDAAWPGADALRPLLGATGQALLRSHAPTLAVTALLLALIGSLESVLNLAAVDQQTEDRHDPNRELVALGAANVVCGVLGGLPLVYLRLRALATLSGGGRSRRALLIGCALLIVVFTLGLRLVEPLPTAVVAGIVVMLAWTLVDRWTRQLALQWWAGDRSADLRWSLAVVALVCAVTLARGFVAGVAAGVLLAMVVFMRAMRHALVRTRYSAADLSSRRVRPRDTEALLAPLRPRIEVIELEGALFFGNAERLLDEAEPAPHATHLTDLVVDLRRVSTVDTSGALTMARLAQRLGRRGIVLRLAGVTPLNRHGRALAAHGVPVVEAAPPVTQGALPAPAPIGLLAYADADRALEAAEEAALARCVAPQARAGAVPLASCRLFEGLDAGQQAVLGARLHERRLVAGERLFAQGQAGAALYLLTAGSISVVDGARQQRFASFAPGMCFGETAVLDRGGRTADAVADLPSVVYALSAADLDALQHDEPALAARVYRNLAQHLSERLRAAAAGWRRAAE